jgi:hypothetical protein
LHVKGGRVMAKNYSGTITWQLNSLPSQWSLFNGMLQGLKRIGRQNWLQFCRPILSIRD